jgi:hypothetical protein
VLKNITNTARNKTVSDWELKCVSRRLSIGGGCLKNQCPHLNTYGRVVFAYTGLSFRSWMSRSPAIVNVSTEQNCIPPTHVWSVHSDMLRGIRACYSRDHRLVSIVLLRWHINQDGDLANVVNLTLCHRVPILGCNVTCGKVVILVVTVSYLGELG